MNTPKIYSEKDLKLIAYLLSSTEVIYKGFRIQEDNTVYCQFEPFATAQNLVNSYYSEDAPPVQPKKLLANLEQARNIVFRAKDEHKFRSQYGGFNQ